MDSVFENNTISQNIILQAQCFLAPLIVANIRTSELKLIVSLDFIILKAK